MYTFVKAHTHQHVHVIYTCTGSKVITHNNCTHTEVIMHNYVHVHIHTYRPVCVYSCSQLRELWFNDLFMYIYTMYLQNLFLRMMYLSR